MCVIAQSKLKYSRAYLGGILQEGRFGGSLLLSYGVNPYFGIGAGVDITTYRRSNNEKAKFFAPFYADIRIRYPIKFAEPFLYGQFGKQAYESSLVNYTDITGVPTFQMRERGQYFYGAGLGVSSKPGGHLGVFVSCTYRLYKFRFDPHKPDINGRIIEDRIQSMLVISAGLMF